MSVTDDVRVLRAEIARSLNALARVETFLDDYLRRLPRRGRTTEQALVVAQCLTNYYTCLETIFFRISQFFENRLPANRWHRAVLDRMVLRVEGVRDPVIADATRAALEELLRFRHFTRYYFAFDYDWAKLDFLLEKYAFVRGSVRRDLAKFDRFLDRLLAAARPPRPTRHPVGGR